MVINKWQRCVVKLWIFGSVAKVLSSLIRVKLVWNKLLKMVKLFVQRSVLLQRRWAARTRGGCWTTWASTTTSWSGPWRRRARPWRSGGLSPLTWHVYYGYGFPSCKNYSERDVTVVTVVLVIGVVPKQVVFNYLWSWTFWTYRKYLKGCFQRRQLLDKHPKRGNQCARLLSAVNCQFLSGSGWRCNRFWTW